MGERDLRLDQIYGAIADPTRRAILAALSRGDIRVGGLADRFPISFNGVSKHVKVLERAGLLERRIQGREHWLKLKPGGLREASRWLDHYRMYWDERLEAMEAFLLRRRRAAGGAVRERRAGRPRS
jgi:DNA-binding transcriptional ArsR family regulator